MGEYLSWTLGSLCIAMAVLKVVGGVWCWVELRRKWRATPELWGIDWLDIVFRVESVFGAPLTTGDFSDWSPAARAELTAGQLWDIIAHKLREVGAVIPPDGWTRLVALLSDALNVRPARITTESRLYADMGMLDGLD